MFLKLQAAVSLFTCTCLLSATTIPANSIGTVTANGEIQVDGSTLRSNSTLFDGSVLQTSDVRSDVRLSDGSQVMLDPSSRMKLYRDHAVLEQGQTMQRNAGKHAVIANGLKVTSENPNGVVLVGIQDRTHMEVESQSGVADVRTPAGNLVARIDPGKTLSFNTAPMKNISPSSIQIAGVVRPVAGHFVLTDAQSGVTFQLQGQDLAAYSGTPVQVIGMVASAMPTATGASSIVDVSGVSPQAATTPQDTQKKKKRRKGAAALPAGSGAMFDVPSILFLVGVAAAGTIGGLAASGYFSSGPSRTTPPTPPVVSIP